MQHSQWLNMWSDYAKDLDKRMSPDEFKKQYLQEWPMPTIRWVFRNDEPAKGAISHAYIDDENRSVCGEVSRRNFDWTELDGERCAKCAVLVGHPVPAKEQQ